MQQSRKFNESNIIEIDDDDELTEQDDVKEIIIEESHLNEYQIDEEYTKIKRPQIDKNYKPGPLQQLDLIFLEIEIDYYEEKKSFDFQVIDLEQLQKTKIKENVSEPIIRIYGVTQNQNSVMVHVRGFEPYLWIECPKGFKPTHKDIENIKNSINERAQYMQKVGKGKKAIKKIEIHFKESVMYFKGKGEQRKPFFKIYTYLASYVSALRSLFEKGFSFDNLQFSKITYESNLPFGLRFMIDKGIVGMNWLKLLAGTYEIRHPVDKQSRCQLEVDVYQKYIHVLKPEGQWQLLPALRLMSIDIECVSKVGFPQPEKDPIISICCVCKTQLEEEPKIKIVFSLKECQNIIGVQVQSFKDEKNMLVEFQKLLQVYDPDIILGYNIINFDFPYILNRAKALNISKFGVFSKNIGVVSRIKDTKFLSKAMGMRETKEINIEGRIQLDMMLHILREHKLSSYSLNSVSYEFLNQQKEDVHHSILYDLFKGTPETRKRIAQYCLKDALLPIKLMDKLMCLYNYTEMSRVTGIPINMLLNRGQQIKVASQLYRKAKDVDILIPILKQYKPLETFEGASVLEPQRGFYTTPIATLDFSSLYPSIMMAHNICYTTLINPKYTYRFTDEDQRYQTPSNHYFVKKHLRKGLLPQILEELIAARKKAKEDLKNETDPQQKVVLDCRQLALKLSANSVYGFTGAQGGQLPCLEISSSVTAIGRQMILQTTQMVSEYYSIRNGYQQNAEVIYGDTDSLMINFGIKNLEQTMKLGKEAAELISQQFVKPIKLEFEKVYYPYLLINRKRYAGLVWTQLEHYDKLDKKGIESVRRDNCFLIRYMMDTVLNLILVQQNIEEAMEFTKNMISDLLQNKIDLSWLIITKGISKKFGEQEHDTNYQQIQEQQTDNQKKSTKKYYQSPSKIEQQTYKAKQAHVELAEKMMKRDSTFSANIGDRIQYVITTGTKGSKNYENAEDPLYVLENDCPIDFNYYLEKQLKPPLIRIFELTIPNPETLFTGEHTRNVYIPKISPKLGGLCSFLKVGIKCLSCQVPMNQGAVCLCCELKGKTIEAYLTKLYEFKRQQTEFNELWTQCQRCQGILHQEVICSNRDCGIYYKRRKAQKDLNNIQNIMQRFTNDW